MQQKKHHVGPRGWAVLTLVGGAALASPFFQSPTVDSEDAVTQPASSHSTGLARLASLEFSASDVNGHNGIGIQRSSYDQSDLTQQILSPATASPTQLPAWAPVRSPIDQLISQGTAPPWQAHSETVSTIKPLTPWTNQTQAGQPRTAAFPPPTATAGGAWPSVSSLPVADRRAVGSAAPAGNTATGNTATGEPANVAAIGGNIIPVGNSSQGSSMGSLAGALQTTRSVTTPRLRAPGPSTAAPARRQFVYQPGFTAPAP